MALLTTTIGAYPKPKYLEVPDWWTDTRRGRGYTFDYVSDYENAIENLGDSAEEVFARATKDAIDDQLESGIDIVTDGEMRRENYIHYHCRRLHGIDFTRRTEIEFRPGHFGHVPTITGPISARESFLDRDWTVAQNFTDKPVKMTMPGPVTIGNACYDEHYDGNHNKRGVDIAEALNQEIKRLAAAGCRYIQIDEPGFARSPEHALDFGFENLDRCWHGVPDSVVRTVHLCCGYPDKLDNPDYPKADQDIYKRLADLVENSLIQHFSLEEAHRHIDLVLLERFKKTTIILGCFDISMSRVETVDEIEGRLRAALEHIDKERLIAAPDCGLALLDRDLAMQKMHNLCAAARRID